MPPHFKGKRNTSHRAQRKGGGGARDFIGEMAELKVASVNQAGVVIALPVKWNDRFRPPHIVVNDQPGLKPGDRILAKMKRLKPHLYHATLIRVLPEEAVQAVLGIFVASGSGGMIEPVSRKVKESYIVAAGHVNGAKNGDLVRGSIIDTPLHGLPMARIEECLGDLKNPRAASLIATQIYNLPTVFPAAALAEAEAAMPPVMETGREDLRDIPLVTIDGEDARDFDDAVFAEPDTHPENKNGFHLLVAIADVAYYVKEGSALDRAAFERGNSVYFPDRVIPMLPERLSNGLCSLKPDEDRYCLAVHLWINEKGERVRYRFVRGLMRSVARLTYTEVEQAHKGAQHKHGALIAHLFKAYRALARERDERGALALELPEYKVQFDAAGNVTRIVPREPLESHKLIESFMVAANVAAAEYLMKKLMPGIFRVHEPPSQEKLEDLRKFLGLSGYSFPKGNITPGHLNRVLHKASEREKNAIIHTAVLRSQMQAYYAHKNLGHFGLGLTHYCHFTSPIRRYSDLIVHRSLMAALSHDKEGLADADKLAEVARHISDTERRAMMAEREASDRYKVSFMSRQMGVVFAGVITSVNEYGVFVTLGENGVTGFVPVRSLGNDFFFYDRAHGSLRGERSRRVFTLGDPLMVKAIQANAITGSLIFEPEGGEKQDGARPRHKGKKPPRKKKKGPNKSKPHKKR